MDGSRPRAFPRTVQPTHERLIGGPREAALLVQQRQHPHGLLQEQVQERTVVLVLDQPGVHVLVQVLVLHNRSETQRCYCSIHSARIPLFIANG